MTKFVPFSSLLVAKSSVNYVSFQIWCTVRKDANMETSHVITLDAYNGSATSKPPVHFIVNVGQCVNKTIENSFKKMVTLIPQNH